MWSAGCVLAEMLNCVNQRKIKESKRVLFYGNFCCPLSPAETDVPENEQMDLLESIIRVRGYPSSQDQSFISDSSGRKYLKNKFSQLTNKKCKLDSLFAHIKSHDLLILLK